MPIPPRGEPSIIDPVVVGAAREGSSRSFRERWMRALRTLGNIQAWIILSLFYVIIIAPLGMIFRCFADPLRVGKRQSNWQATPSQYDRLDTAIRQS